MIRKDFSEIFLKIKKEIPYFDNDGLLDYTKWAVQNLFDSLKSNDKSRIKVKYSEELITKLLNEKEKYRLTKNIDNMNIQYTQLYDFIKKDNEIYIQVYASVYFYDNTNNNFYFDDAKDKYWNDIWIITYKETGDVGNNCNCTNCGAVMEYNKFKDLFECQYCGNVVDNRLNKNWEIVDIELGNVEYEI